MEVQVIPNGDIFEIEADALAHGCNCLGVMGAGVALQVRTRMPSVYSAYQTHVKKCGYKKELLAGTCQMVQTDDKIVFNLFTQYEMGRHAKAEYVQSAFREMFQIAALKNLKTIVIPQIGAGIGGMKWEDVLFAIEQAEQEASWEGTLIIAIRT